MKYMSKNIPCSELGCTAQIINPCQKVTSLLSAIAQFGFKLYTTKSLDVNWVIERDKFGESIESVTRQIIDEGAINFEKEMIQFLQKDSPETKSRILTLRCIKGHVNQYTITCEE